MDAVVELVKVGLVPGSFAFLLIAVSLGIPGLFLDAHWRRRSRTWLAGVVLVYWLLSLPACASTIEAGVDRGYDRLSAAQAEGLHLQTVVILGGGIEAYRQDERMLITLSEPTAERVLEGARVYELLDEPRVIVSGGGSAGRLPGEGGIPESRAMRQALVSLGVPDERILEESTSTNTREEALNLEAHFADVLGEPFVLVTSPVHMRRALATFRAVGLEPIASPSQGGRAAPALGLRGFVPSLDSLRASTFALRETMALAYYWLRGWTGGQ